jgi:hypothetical protein
MPDSEKDHLAAEWPNDIRVLKRHFRNKRRYPLPAVQVFLGVWEALRRTDQVRRTDSPEGG